MIHAVLGSASVRVSEEVHRVLAHVTGRPIASAKDLTRTEASRVIEWLNGAEHSQVHRVAVAVATATPNSEEQDYDHLDGDGAA